MQEALSDHVNHPNGVCSHPDPKLAEVDREATVVSAVMDLSERRLWLSDGMPCSNPHREAELSRPLVPTGHRATALPS